MAKRKGQQCLLMSERLSCSFDGFCGASEQEAGAFITCRLADGSGFVDQIILKFIALRVEAGVEMFCLFYSQPLTLL